MSWKDVKNAAQNTDEATEDVVKPGEDILRNLYKDKEVRLNPVVFKPINNRPGIDPGNLPEIDPDDIVPGDFDPGYTPDIPEIKPRDIMPGDPIPPIDMPYFPDIPFPSNPDNNIEPDCSEVINEIRGKIAEYLALQAGKDPEYAESLGQAVTAYANAGDEYEDQGLTGQAYDEAMKAAAQKAIKDTDVSLDDLYGFNCRAKTFTDEITNEDEPGKTIPGTIRVKPDPTLASGSSMDDSSSLDGTKGAAESLKEMIGKSVGSGVSGAINNIVRGLPDDFISDSAPEDNGLGL